jgi:light-regulated signal transduction histidine kinase (bacteriophytochrome)
VLSQVLDSASDDDPADFVERLVAEAAPLSELVSADGVYVRFGGAWRASGLLPPVESLPDLFGLLPVTSAGRPWSTHRLGDELGDRGELAGDCAGLMLVRMGSGDDVVAWFRGDASLNVRWATDPSRPVVLGSRGQRLTPRGSSMVWHETARGQSAPWTEEEHGIAEESYRWLFEFAVRRAAALSAANAELARSNDELDAFAYVASHDLKEPLRGVANYATFIAEDATGLDEQTLVRLATIRRLVTRMDGLLNSLLEYSRLGRADLAAEEIPLDTLVDEIAEMLGPQLAEAGVELRRPMPLGSVSGDRIRVQEVLVNLITNAVKYAAESAPRWVEVGVARVVPDGSSEPVPAIYVWDNGIGIRPEQQENIFKIFRRLHAPGVRGGGAGAGLTISRRIVERHGGRLWVRSVPGEGSTFYFTL